MMIVTDFKNGLFHDLRKFRRLQILSRLRRGTSNFKAEMIRRPEIPVRGDGVDENLTMKHINAFHVSVGSLASIVTKSG
jgi:hypothetical protein